jgi:hypothetical protein
MIRDPSDCSVKEKPVDELPSFSGAAAQEAETLRCVEVDTGQSGGNADVEPTVEVKKEGLGGGWRGDQAARL